MKKIIKSILSDLELSTSLVKKVIGQRPELSEIPTYQLRGLISKQLQTREVEKKLKEFFIELVKDISPKIEI